jgi:hypothetical protein
METSDVRSIDALRDLRRALGELSHGWDSALQQIRFSMHRIEEHFSTTMPNYWKTETRKAEQKLTEAMDNLSRQKGSSSDPNPPAATEAKQRVNSAKRRLTFCEEKQRAATRIAINVERACQELLGPIAEATGHVSTTLPNAAIKLAVMIEQLDRYAEMSLPPTSPATGAHAANDSFLPPLDDIAPAKSDESEAKPG